MARKVIKWILKGFILSVWIWLICYFNNVLDMFEVSLLLYMSGLAFGVVRLIEEEDNGKKHNTRK